MHAALVSRVKVMSKMDIAEHHRPRTAGSRCPSRDARSTSASPRCRPCSARRSSCAILDKENLTFNLDLLGVPPDMLKHLKLLLAKPYGLMLVTGPTGSGKTTTLYSALELIKSVHRNVVSVEDPVEYQVELVNQIQVDESRSLSFSSALRSILRQDPDIIMIGEIRDADTARIAVQAALTGHLVLSTLHTNDCAGAVHRLMDMGIEPYKIAARAGGRRRPATDSDDLPGVQDARLPVGRTARDDPLPGRPPTEFHPRRGLPKCHDTGFTGRTGIYEVMVVDREIRERHRRLGRHGRDSRLLSQRRRQDPARAGDSPRGKRNYQLGRGDASRLLRVNGEARRAVWCRPANLV